MFNSDRNSVPKRRGRLRVPAEASKSQKAEATPSDMDNTGATTEEAPSFLHDGIISGDVLADMAIPSRESIIGDWFREGDLGFVFGARGLGKTWFGGYLASLITGGGQFESPWSVYKTYPVLYVDGEMPIDEMQRRFQQLKCSNEQLHILNHEVLVEAI